MRNGLWTKGLVIGIIILFIGTNMISNISGIIIDIKDKSGALPNINQECKGLSDYYPTIILNFPPSTPAISPVQLYGLVGNAYDLSATSIDPEGEDVYYLIDWGNGNYSDWFGPFKSGVEIMFSLIFNTSGLYQLKVKSNDTSGHESNWSEISFFYIYEEDVFETVFFCGFGSDTTPSNDSLWAFDPNLVLRFGFSPFHLNFLTEGRYIIQLPRGLKTSRFIMGIFPVMKFVE